MRFEKLDLNLLLVLDALIRDGSVSMAAERVSLSQSATSSALGRLRLFFEDELLVPRGRGMVLTPRAEELREPVAAVLAQIRDTIVTPRTFDPGSTDRTLVVTASDYGVEVLIAPALRTLEALAPGLAVQIVPIGEQPLEQLSRGHTDLLITTDTVISTENPSRYLFEDDFVVVAWRDGAALRQPMTVERYSELGHVAARFGRAQTPSFEEWVHRQRDVTRRVEVVAPNFVSVAALVSGTNRIATMHRRLAIQLADIRELAIVEAPLEIPPVRIFAQWLANSFRDPALSWFVERLAEQATLSFGRTPPTL